MTSPSVISRELNPFAQSVREGLLKPGQRELPFMYLYDDLGTALFEAISLLPEYGLAHADLRLIQNHSDSILNHLKSPLFVVELGSGNGEKTHWLLKALSGRQPTDYFPIDLSELALLKCSRALSDLAGVRVQGLKTTYLEGLRQAAATRKKEETLLTLFLGSSIGNFDRKEARTFLQVVRNCLEPGDGLLIGFDLVKPAPEMLLAYDDPLGVTAAFNLNYLARINRELSGNFRLDGFEHVAKYDETKQQVEMHLQAKLDQRILIRGINIEFPMQGGETIRTEVSRKFTPEKISSLAEECGFIPQAQWIDPSWPFCESLWRASQP